MAPIDASIVAVMAQALVILLIGWATHEKFTYKGAIANGIMVIFAGGTLLYHAKAGGFLLLAYGAFMMVAGMEEYELHRMKKGIKPSWLSYVILFFGNYIIAAVVVLVSALWSYGVWPF